MQLHRTAKSCKVDSTSTDNITHFRHHLNRMQLTGEQTKIIKHHGGHARISAVAGSGKTTAMVGRVQHLLQQGVTPDKILVLMFNKSAREAFADRLQLLLEGTGLQSPSVRTFHSLGLRLINSFTARKILPSYKLLTEEYHVEKLAREAIKKYASQVVKNAAILAEKLMDKNFDLITDGTENHLMLVDLTSKNITGKIAAKALDRAGIVLNYNSVPFDNRKPFDPSGIRLGTSAVTTRGFKEPEMAIISDLIDMVISNPQDATIIKKVASRAKELCSRFPAPGLEHLY